MKIQEPKVKIARVCRACGNTFALTHPSDPNLYCERCREILNQMIRERIKEE